MTDLKGERMSILMGNNLWQLVASADTMSKGVLFTLLAMSIVCWTIFFYKLILLRIKREQMREALSRMKSVATVHELVALSTEMGKTLPGYVLLQGLTFTKKLLDQRKTDLLSTREWEGVEQHIEQATEDVLVQEEKYLPILFASAGVATLVGLFGTVWGLIHAFVRIAEKQSADIATIAPGIAEALITTLAGLIVAIPAFLMYHYFTVQNRAIEHQLFQFVDKFRWLTKNHFVRHDDVAQWAKPVTPQQTGINNV
jgi:biopolymer transport protein TolQ